MGIKRDRLKQLIENAFTNGSAGEVAEAICQAIEEMPKKRRKDPETKSSRVWQAYSEAWKTRYGSEPVRNATTNSQCANLVGRFGEERCVELVAFYCQQNDSFYAWKMHPLGVCLRDSDTLMARMTTRIQVTRTQAQRIEKTSGSASASLEYLKKKYAAPLSCPICADRDWAPPNSQGKRFCKNGHEMPQFR